jgi:hypothetical protein
MLKQRVFLIVMLLLILFYTARIKGNNHYPEFKWDTVPVYLHFWKEGTLNEKELQRVAKLCSFVCFEKAHGKIDLADIELAVEQEAKKLKKIKPSIKVLFYWNSFLAYPFTSYVKNIIKDRPDLLFRDKIGKVIKKKDSTLQYNLLNTDFQKWWGPSQKTNLDETWLGHGQRAGINRCCEQYDDYGEKEHGERFFNHI